MIISDKEVQESNICDIFIIKLELNSEKSILVIFEQPLNISPVCNILFENISLIVVV